MNMNEQVMELIEFARSRRNLVAGSVGVGGALGLANAAAIGRAFAQELSDLDILNFALTLEHLESRMYADMLATNILTGKELQYFTSFGQHEAAHVKAITDTINSLGGSPVQALDSYNFPAFNNRGDILNFAKIAEDIGVSAYQGAAAAIDNKDILAAAGSIVQVEARHAAIVNLLLGKEQPVPDAFTSSLTPAEVLDQINPILGQ
jgi:rubrerythrin